MTKMQEFADGESHPQVLKFSVSHNAAVLDFGTKWTYDAQRGSDALS